MTRRHPETETRNATAGASDTFSAASGEQIIVSNVWAATAGELASSVKNQKSPLWRLARRGRLSNGSTSMPLIMVFSISSHDLWHHWEKEEPPLGGDTSPDKSYQWCVARCLLMVTSIEVLWMNLFKKKKLHMNMHNILQATTHSCTRKCLHERLYPLMKTCRSTIMCM